MTCGKPGLNRRQFLNRASIVAASAVISRSNAALVAQGPWRGDGTGMARIGLLVPSHDFNPESEIWAMAPKGVAILASRMDRGTLPFVKYISDASHADAAIGLLKTLKLRVILYAYSGTSYAMGLAGEEAFRARLVARVQGVPIVLAATALSEALRALNVHRLAVVHPPWYPEELNDMGKAYFSARGFEIVSCARITPARELTEVEAEEVHGWIAANTPSGESLWPAMAFVPSARSTRWRRRSAVRWSQPTRRCSGKACAWPAFRRAWITTVGCSSCRLPPTTKGLLRERP